MRIFLLPVSALLSAALLTTAQAGCIEGAPSAPLENPCLATDGAPRPCSEEAEAAYVEKLADQEVAAFKARHPKATAEQLKIVRQQVIEQYEDSKTLRGL